MNIKDAQETVDKTIQEYGGYWEPLSMLARLTEEVGELARAMNQEYGGKRKKSDDDGREIEKELADVLYTVLAIANSQKIDIGEKLQIKIEESHPKYKEIYSK
jgi:NTP pyrophosphatase (non-canonical NTP hydrolase)